MTGLGDESYRPPVVRRVFSPLFPLLLTIGFGGCGSFTQPPASRINLQPIPGKPNNAGASIGSTRSGSPQKVSATITVTFIAAGEPKVSGDKSSNQDETPPEGSLSDDPDVAADDAIEALWRSADVGPLDPAIRRRYRSNAMRLGVLHDSEPVDRLHRRVEPPRDPHHKLITAADVRDDASGTQLSFDLAADRPVDIIAAKPLAGSRTFLASIDGRVIGKTLSAAQTTFSTRWVAAHGTAGGRVSITPTIQHGQNRRTFVSSEAAIRIDSQRPRWTINPLQIDWDAADGETLLIGPTERSDDIGLGPWFLSPAGRPMIIAITLHR